MDNLEDLQAELKKTQLAYQMAIQLSQLKTGFLARIAHELRSPLSSMMGLHQLILTDLCESPQEEREFIKQSYQAAQKLIGIIDEIVTVSKIEYGSITLTIDPVSINKIFQDLYQATHLQAANRNLKLNVFYPPNDIYVLADVQRLLQVLVTLVDTGVSLVEAGNIVVSFEKNYPITNVFLIVIDFPCSATLWREAEKLPEFKIETRREAISFFSQKISISPPLKFLLAKAIIESMKGEMNLIANSSANATQIRCLLPLISVETPAQ